MIQTIRRGVIDQYNGFTFLRTSTAYDTKGRFYLPNNARFVDGGIMVEEETTNLISGTNGVSNFSVGDGAQLITVTHPIWGKQVTAIKLPAGSTVPVATGPALNLSPNTQYTVSFDVWATGASRFDVDLSPDTLPQQDQNISGSFQRIAWTLSSSSTDMGSCKLRFFNDIVKPNPYDIYITNVQLEQKPYPTSFIDGTRSPETLTIPTAGVITPANGFYAQLWFIAKRTLKHGQQGFLLEVVTATGAERWGLGFVGGSTLEFRRYDDNGVWTGLYASDITQINEGNVFVSVQDDPPTNTMTMHVGINGGPLKKYTCSSGNPITSVSTLYVGCGGSGNQCGGLIKNLRISSRARTDAEIAEAYTNGVTIDDDTTFLMDTDRPFAQRAAKALVL